MTVNRLVEHASSQTPIVRVEPGPSNVDPVGRDPFAVRPYFRRTERAPQHEPAPTPVRKPERPNTGTKQQAPQRGKSRGGVGGAFGRQNRGTSRAPQQTRAKNKKNGGATARFTGRSWDDWRNENLRQQQEAQKKREEALKAYQELPFEKWPEWPGDETL